MNEPDTIRIPSLAGGVSRQPPHVRFPDQVETADNIRFSVEDGASKRPGSEYVCDIDFTTGSKFNGDSDPRVHMIERDENELYVAKFGPNIARSAFVMSVHDTSGNEATVSGYSGDVQTYLETNLVSFTSGDYTTATRTVTSTGAFTDYTFKEGDKLYVSDWGTTGGSPTTGYFLIESRTSDNAIVLKPQSAQSETLPNANSTGQVDGGIGSADDYRLITVADTTIIVNTRAAVAMENSADYDVAHTAPTYRDLLSYTPGNDEYVRTESADDDEVAGYWQYTPDGDLTYPYIEFTAVVDDWANPTAEWDDGQMGFKISQARTYISGISSADYNHTTRTITSTGNFASYTYRPGDMIYITDWGTLSGSPTTGWFLVASATDNTVVLAEQAKQTGTLPTSTDTGQVDANDDPDGGALGCVFGQEIEVVVDFSGNNKQYSMHDIAAEIEAEMTGQGWANAGVAWVPVTAGGYFQITGSFRGSTGRVFTPDSPHGAGTPEDLTASGKPFNGGTATAGTGTLGATDQLTVPNAYRWTRVAAPGQKKASFSPETMPVKLERTDVYPSLTFTLSTIPWVDRKVGDEKTNPAPKPFQNSDTTSAYIDDAAYFEGRLFLAVGEYAIFSEADNLYNLFLANDEQTVDSDRISRPIGTNRIANIKYAVPFRKSILLLTKAGQQYQIGFDTALSPSSVFINATSTFRTAAVRPVVMGPFMYLVSEKDGGTAIWEYFFDESSGSYLANEITKHIEGYVPTGIRTLAADSVQGALLCCPIDSRYVYVYRTTWNGNQKVLSAWSRYVFDSTYDIQDIGALGGDCYLLTYISGEWMLERLPLSPISTPSGFTFVPHMDRQRLIPDADLSYDGGNDWTVIDLQGTKASSSTYNAYILPDGTYVTASDSGQSWNYGTGGGLGADDYISVDGDITGSDPGIYLGRYYESKLVLTRPFRRNQNGHANTAERLVIETAWVSHSDTGDYMVLREPDNANWNDAATLQQPSTTTASGYLRVPVRGDADEETMTITDAVQGATAASFASKPAVATPMNITGIEFDVEAQESARRN